MKTTVEYICSSCGAKSPKSLGRCPVCGQWNTYEETIVANNLMPTKNRTSVSIARPIKLNDIDTRDEIRIDLKNSELNRVLGGGLVPGSMILLGGEPGIGKSTLALQVLMQLEDKVCLYASGEESVRQIKLRANRIDGKCDNLYIMSDTSLENILSQTRELQPCLAVIDSIQTIGTSQIDSSIGGIAQIKECAVKILQYAKESNTSFILIGHINKEGALAGPKVLEHIVDTVLQFEGDQHYLYRILRAQKNRFGNTSEIGIYEMLQNGLRCVINPSELLLSSAREGLSGVAVAATIEGIRPFLIEVQALVSSATYGTPQRSSMGFDPRRLNMLLAVLEKRIGFKLLQKDVFLNIAGGIRISDPAIDLAVLASVLSSNMDIALPQDVCLTGEVGLAGEIRPVNRIETRIQEAKKMGFNKIIIPKDQKVTLKNTSIELLPFRHVADALQKILKN